MAPKKASVAPVPGNDAQKSRDVAFIFDLICAADVPLVLNVSNCAQKMGVKPNSIAKRLGEIRKRNPELKVHASSAAGGQVSTPKLVTSRKNVPLRQPLQTVDTGSSRGRKKSSVVEQEDADELQEDTDDADVLQEVDVAAAKATTSSRKRKRTSSLNSDLTVQETASKKSKLAGSLKNVEVSADELALDAPGQTTPSPVIKDLSSKCLNTQHGARSASTPQSVDEHTDADSAGTIEDVRHNDSADESDSGTVNNITLAENEGQQTADKVDQSSKENEAHQGEEMEQAFSSNARGQEGMKHPLRTPNLSGKHQHDNLSLVRSLSEHVQSSQIDLPYMPKRSANFRSLWEARVARFGTDSTLHELKISSPSKHRTSAIVTRTLHKTSTDTPMTQRSEIATPTLGLIRTPKPGHLQASNSAISTAASAAIPYNQFPFQHTSTPWRRLLMLQHHDETEHINANTSNLGATHKSSRPDPRFAHKFENGFRDVEGGRLYEWMCTPTKPEDQTLTDN